MGTKGGTKDEFYRERKTKVVHLNRRHGTSTERGRFRCEVPDASNTMQTVYVNIGMYASQTHTNAISMSTMFN